VVKWHFTTISARSVCLPGRTRAEWFPELQVFRLGRDRGQPADR
jgi:hypothetical protein